MSDGFLRTFAAGRKRVYLVERGSNTASLKANLRFPPSQRL